MIALTATSRSPARFSRDSSLPALNRVKRSCHAWRLRRAAAAASPAGPRGPAPVTKTPQVPPKHRKVHDASVTTGSR